jgi:hypothetical protein
VTAFLDLSEYPWLYHGTPNHGTELGEMERRGKKGRRGGGVTEGRKDGE